MGKLSGMTGFGRSGGEADWGSWVWELKSVNGRGLDIRSNTPPGFDGIDRSARQKLSKALSRGNIQMSLRIDAQQADNELVINEPVLAYLTKRHEKLSGYAISGDALATLMTIRGVIETGGNGLKDIIENEQAVAEISDSFLTALTALEASRHAEGEALAGVLGGLLDQMQTAREQAGSLAEEQPALIKQRLETKLSELLQDHSPDAERLMLDAAMVAAKADIQEELDRLSAHISSGRGHLEGGSPVGRKLDFLAQELNREVNTLCSKSASIQLTETGLEMKALVDQFKEQAANVE